jgi:hypothetical protein
MHDSRKFLVGIDRAIGGFFIFEGSVGIYCCFYKVVRFSFEDIMRVNILCCFA